MKAISSPRHWFARQRSIGADGGWLTFGLSNLVLLLTAGLSGLGLWYQVWRLAYSTPSRPEANHDGWIVVLGARLRHDQVTPGYARRLHRAAALYREQPQRRMLLTGGYTGGSVSEARCGQEFLLALGIPSASLVIEDESLNTLVNLRRARQLFPELRKSPFILITSRHHLARSQRFAQGLGLQPILCSAESTVPCYPMLLWRCGLEAYYLHWYIVGKTWSRWTQNTRNLARIS